LTSRRRRSTGRLRSGKPTSLQPPPRPVGDASSPTDLLAPNPNHQSVCPERTRFGLLRAHKRCRSTGRRTAGRRGDPGAHVAAVVVRQCSAASATCPAVAIVFPETAIACSDGADRRRPSERPCNRRSRTRPSGYLDAVLRRPHRAVGARTGRLPSFGGRRPVVRCVVAPSRRLCAEGQGSAGVPKRPGTRTARA
jgi:hypothetical protein